MASHDHDQGTERPTRPVDGFFAYELRVGTVVEARVNPGARRPAYVLTIDFGPWGRRTSSAQITRHYRPQALVGRQVVAVLNLPTRWVAGVPSQVLVLGACPEDGEVILLQPDRPVPDGSPVA